MTSNYMSYEIFERERKKKTKMNWLKAALCNTHHNSTIETNISGKMGKSPSTTKKKQSDIFQL